MDPAVTPSGVVPGQPDKSLLIKAVHYGDKLQMPPKGRLKRGQRLTGHTETLCAAPLESLINSMIGLARFPYTETI